MATGDGASYVPHIALRWSAGLLCIARAIDMSLLRSEEDAASTDGGNMVGSAHPTLNRPLIRLIRLIRDSDKIITRPQHLNHGNHHNHMNHSSDIFAADQSFRRHIAGISIALPIQSLDPPECGRLVGSAQRERARFPGEGTSPLRSTQSPGAP